MALHITHYSCMINWAAKFTNPSKLQTTVKTLLTETATTWIICSVHLVFVLKRFNQSHIFRMKFVYIVHVGSASGGHGVYSFLPELVQNVRLSLVLNKTLSKRHIWRSGPWNQSSHHQTTPLPSYSSVCWSAECDTTPSGGLQLEKQMTIDDWRKCGRRTQTDPCAKIPAESCSWRLQPLEQQNSVTHYQQGIYHGQMVETHT